MFLDEKRFGEAQTETWQDRTIAVLRKYGWKQGGYGAPGGPRCIAGAIAQTNREADIDSILERLRKHLGMPVWQWNDVPGRTVDEVIALLSAAC